MTGSALVRRRRSTSPATATTIQAQYSPPRARRPADRKSRRAPARTNRRRRASIAPLELADLEDGRALAPAAPAEQVGDGDHAERDRTGDERHLRGRLAGGLLAFAHHLFERGLQIVAGDAPSVGFDCHDYSFSAPSAGAGPRRAAGPWVI